MSTQFLTDYDFLAKYGNDKSCGVCTRLIGIDHKRTPVVLAGSYGSDFFMHYECAVYIKATVYIFLEGDDLKKLMFRSEVQRELLGEVNGT